MLNDHKKLYEFVNDISIKYFERPFRDRVRFNNRLRTTGGRYIPSEKMIELNPKYILEMDIEEVIGIVKHELCHYHLHIQGKGYRHGDRDFKELLKKTGSPRFCNPLPSNQAKNNYYIYICIKCKHEYKRKRRVNVKRFVCGRCGGNLQKQKDK